MKKHIYKSASIVLALVTLGGCATLNDCCYEKSQEIRAVTQYLKCGQPECSPHPKDYKCGWIAGFYEVATGGSTCPPPFAPETYYKPGVILKDRDSRRHAWYSGWQDGASRAALFPDTHYLRVYETCECPFPRCEEPCGDGACSPCQVPSIGLSSSDEMIEIAPMASQPLEMAPVPYMEGGFPEPMMWDEDISVKSSSNRDAELPEPTEEGKPAKNGKPSKKAVEAAVEKIQTPTPDDSTSTSGIELNQLEVGATAHAFSLFVPEGPECSTVGFVKLATSGRAVPAMNALSATATPAAQPSVSGKGIVKEVLDNPFGMLESEPSK